MNPLTTQEECFLQYPKTCKSPLTLNLNGTFYPLKVTTVANHHWTEDPFLHSEQPNSVMMIKRADLDATEAA